MRHAIASVFIILTLSGCTTTKTVIEYREVTKKLPDVLMTECIMPFDARPATYGEAVERDEVWRNSFVLCAKKIAGIRQYYSQKQKGLK